MYLKTKKVWFNSQKKSLKTKKHSNKYINLKPINFTKQAYRESCKIGTIVIIGRLLFVVGVENKHITDRYAELKIIFKVRNFIVKLTLFFYVVYIKLKCQKIIKISFFSLSFPSIRSNSLYYPSPKPCLLNPKPP